MRRRHRPKQERWSSPSNQSEHLGALLAPTSYAGPNSPIDSRMRCRVRVKLRNARNEHIFSAMPPIADVRLDLLAAESVGAVA